MRTPTSLIIVYISLATGCVLIGVILTFLVILASQYFGINLLKNFWLLAIPVTLSVLLNILFIELYSKFKKK